jgi:hypothetical protein
MKNLILIFTFCACFSSLYARESNKREALKRLSLMSYVSHVEGQYPYDLKWETLKTSYFSIFSKAHAYKEGDPCLILGFQSVYKNGMCRLSLAKGAKEYKNSCRIGEYACNPQVFGKNESKPFCVSASMGSELSKYCSHKSIASLYQTESASSFSKETQDALKKVSNTNPRDFNFEMIIDATDDNKFNESLAALYKDPLTIEKSKEFTTTLCGAIQSSRKSKAHGLDLSSCEAQLKILSSTDSKEEVENTEKELKEIKREITSHDPNPKEAVEIETVKVVTSKLVLEEPKRACAPEVKRTETEKNIEDIKEITNNLEANLYMKCINELYYHDDLPVETRGNYFHKIGEQQNFAKQCWKLDNHGDKEIVYSFVSEDGFKMIKYPVYNYTIAGTDIETSHPRNLLKFHDGNKAYYISQFDNIGQYFDSLPVDQLEEFVTERDLMNSATSLQRKYIRPYEELLAKDGKSKKVQLTTPEEAGYSTDQAKSCIKERLNEYVGIIMSRSHVKVLPYTNELNADLQVSPRSSLSHKYSKTIEQIKAELKAEIVGGSSACQSIIDESDFTKAFEKAYVGRIENYTKYRHYFID